MTDIKTPEERSRNMSKIRSKDTKPEIVFRKMLFAEGYRYRKNVTTVPGHPDLYLPKYHTAVFINGCFWHRHAGCKYAYTPKSRTEFWEKKFAQNIKRDQAVHQMLRQQGIKCMVVWECTVKKMQKDKPYLPDYLNIIRNFFNSDEQYIEL